MADSADERIHILVVDDLPEKLLVMESILADLGVNIVLARSGAEALQFVLQQDFAVILLDVNMPDIDGYETASFIRGRKRSALTPIIFITGYADELHKTQGYSLGAVDYIFSPVVPEILRTKVKVFVDLFRMTQEVRNHAEQRIALAKEQAAREAAERMAAALQQSEERFRLASEAVTGFIYEFDVLTGQVTVSPGLTDLLGFVPDDAGDLSWWTSRIHPEDLAAGRFPIEEILRECPRRYRSEYRVRHENGHYLHVWDQGLVVSHRPGVPLRLVGNVVDITERKRAEMALAEASRRKDEFLAMLAHELRNPLAPIRSALQILRLPGTSASDVEWTRDMIERNVNQLVRLVDDLLDVSRIDRGKIRLVVEPVELTAVVAQAVEISRPLIEVRRHQLSVHVPNQPLRVNGDATRLAQIVANLLNNAAKYTDEEGMIDLSLEREAGEAVLRVRDTGVGLSPEMLDTVFDLFMQADRSLDRSQGGLGIGLTLVRRLVSLHGGTVRATSEGPGRGSEFTVSLPAIPEDPAPLPESRHRDLGLSAGRFRRAMIVDDNIDAAKSLSTLLKLAGHDVHLVHDGLTALDDFARFRPDVILLDIGLPGLNGYEVARRLRQLPETNDVLLLAITGYGQDEDRRRSEEAGFDYHLVKPVDLAVLAEILGQSSGRSGSPIEAARVPV